MNKERLLNVAKALRESPHPERFDMGAYAHSCGTPACAFGHYAARRDLQQFLAIDSDSNADCDSSVKYVYDDGLADYDDDEILEHFGISFDEAWDLFSSTGCGRAKTVTQAAEYIERFVAEH